MVSRKRSLLVPIIGVLFPLVAHAQGILKSNNYSLDNINFGSNFAITSSHDGIPPAISSDGPTVIELDHDHAVIVWKTDKKSTSIIAYGLKNTYGQESGTSDLVTDHKVTVLGLKAQTTYHYQAVSTDVFGVKGMSDDKTFTTPAQAGITSIKINSITYDSALIEWTTGNYTSSKINYGTTTKYGASKISPSLSFETDHTVQLTKLTPGTEYHLQIVATNDKGDTATSSDFTFKTIADPIFTLISDTSVDPNTLTNGVVTYRQSASQDTKSTGSAIRELKHVTTLSSLQGDTDYSYTIAASDEQGHQVTSPEKNSTRRLIMTHLKSPI
jgi:hypothetical protein